MLCKGCLCVCFVCLSFIVCHSVCLFCLPVCHSICLVCHSVCLFCLPVFVYHSMCLFCLSVCHSVCLSLYVSVLSSCLFYLPVRHSLSITVYESVLSACLSLSFVCHSMCLFRLPACHSVYVSACLSLCLFYLPACHSVYLSTCLFCLLSGEEGIKQQQPKTEDSTTYQGSLFLSLQPLKLCQLFLLGLDSGGLQDAVKLIPWQNHGLA